MEPCRKVKLSVALPESKVGLDAGHRQFIWHSGDQISVFNNINTSSVAFNVSETESEVDVPQSASILYGVYPCTAGSRPDAVSVQIPVNQLQAAGGVFPSKNYPMSAVASIADNAATMMFKPLASVLALNIYGGNGSIKAVRVTPLSNNGFAGTASVDVTSANAAFVTSVDNAKAVTISLTSPTTVGAKPENDTQKRTFPGQIYVCLARQVYSNLQIEVDLGGTIYRFTTSKTFEFDCAQKDIIYTGLNLEKGTVDVSGVTGEAFDASGSFEKMAGSLSPLTYLEDKLDDVDRIPDFSRVGYKYGDEAILTRPVVRTITMSDVASAIASSQAADTTDFIQQALDAVGDAGGGALLLKNGTYNVSRILFIDKDNVVLRGESRDGTIIKNNSSIQAPVIYVGRSQAKQAGETETDNLTFVAGRRVRVTTTKTTGTGGNASYGEVTLVTYTPLAPSMTIGANTLITEDYVPLGRLWVQVANPKLFKVGDPVRIYRKSNSEWLTDIGMDRIPENGRTSSSGTKQWDLSTYTFGWTRKVTEVRGNRIYLDAPVPMSLESRYGGADLQHYSWNRVKGCGVENLTIDCKYDDTLVNNGKEVDEAHAWKAVVVGIAEHCWVRNVTSKHMGYGLADLREGARCITVENCRCLTPVSIVSGSRRYAYCISKGAELCLVKNCYCEDDRHSFVTNGPALGPNVFTECESVNGNSSVGPHWGWATATLYDCIVADTNFEAQDGSHQGTGHGWRGVNTVFWNVSTTKNIVCQNVWGTCFTCGAKWNQTSVCKECGEPIVPSGRNYAVGCIGTKKSRTVYYHLDYYNQQTEDYFVNLYGYGSNGENRPDGEWYPSRMYEESGGSPIMLPYEAPVSWWPVFTITSFSKPASLYQSQLEDRHARGVYLNNL